MQCKDSKKKKEEKKYVITYWHQASGSICFHSNLMSAMAKKMNKEEITNLEMRFSYAWKQTHIGLCYAVWLVYNGFNAVAAFFLPTIDCFQVICNYTRIWKMHQITGHRCLTWCSARTRFLFRLTCDSCIFPSISNWNLWLTGDNYYYIIWSRSSLLGNRLIKHCIHIVSVVVFSFHWHNSRKNWQKKITNKAELIQRSETFWQLLVEFRCSPSMVDATNVTWQTKGAYAKEKQKCACVH